MIKKIGLFIIIPTLLFSACQTRSSGITSSSTSEPEPQELKTDIEVDMTPNFVEREEPYHLQFEYNDEYFNRPATTYDKDLSLVSFGAVLSGENASKTNAFYTKAQFNDFVIHHYEETPTEDSVGYFMGHKTIGKSELFTVSVRGFNYEREWANNFLIGAEGDHQGFLSRGNEIYEQLKTYISSYKGDRTIKLWIIGYSRGGAIANVLSSLVLRNNEIAVEQNNMFTYTYEAPACLSESNAIAYENVHNIINKNDLITNIPPASYGLGRCGVDYEIYDPEYSTIIKTLDENINIPEFVEIDASELLSKDEDLVAYILKTVFNSTAEEQYLANTRTQYVEHYQAGLSYMIGLLFALKPSTRSKMLTDLSNMGFSAITLISDETGVEFANFFKTYLELDEISYDLATLTTHCIALRNAAAYLLLFTLLIYINEDYSPSLMRLIDMHYVESVYVLLLNAHNK